MNEYSFALSTVWISCAFKCNFKILNYNTLKNNFEVLMTILNVNFSKHVFG